MGFINQLAEQTAGGAINAGMGIIMGGINDRRQLKQQEKLQALQIGGQKQMVDYNMMKELQMWKDTNYGAQIEEMEKAGINPALLYGMKGGGGVTTGSPGGNVTGGEAPKGGGEMQSMIQMGIQSRLLQAQEANIQAQTEKTKVETEKLAGADTENVQANTALTAVKTDIAKIEKQIAGRTTEDAITTIQHNALRVMDEARSALAKANIDESTWEQNIEKVQVELAGLYIRNDVAKSHMQLNEATINKMANEIIQGYKKLEIDTKNADTNAKRQAWDKYINDVRNSTRLTVQTIEGIVGSVLSKGKRTTTTTTEGMKDREGGYYEQRTTTQH